MRNSRKEPANIDSQRPAEPRGRRNRRWATRTPTGDDGRPWPGLQGARRRCLGALWASHGAAFAYRPGRYPRALCSPVAIGEFIARRRHLSARRPS